MALAGYVASFKLRDCLRDLAKFLQNRETPALTVPPRLARLGPPCLQNFAKDLVEDKDDPQHPQKETIINYN